MCFAGEKQSETDRRDTRTAASTTEKQLHFMMSHDTIRDPNALHNFHKARRGPKNVPELVLSSGPQQSVPKDPGHPYAQTSYISFQYFEQRKTNAPFGYEHYVSLPPGYNVYPTRKWPLILFLHGAGQSQRNTGESYLSIRHGIPKMILCYDKLKAGEEPCISIPLPPRMQKNKQTEQCDLTSSSVSEEACILLAENFITVTPSCNVRRGYGWAPAILTALLNEVVERYRVDVDKLHVTGFSMGGYGAWDLVMATPRRFASAVPICGGGNPANASLVEHLPFWIFHGAQDDIIPVEASQQMTDALRSVGGLDVQLTKYPDLMHDSWTRAYNDPNLYRWMLQKRSIAHVAHDQENDGSAD